MTEQCGAHTHDCGCQQEGVCHCQSCGCSKHHHGHDEEGNCCCAEKLLMVADEAWKEVLKDKIKEKIIAKKGEHLDKLAELIAVTNGEKWKHKISARLKCDEYKDQLKEFFSSCDK